MRRFGQQLVQTGRCTRALPAAPLRCFSDQAKRTKKAKKVKTWRDPQKPKKPITAYFQFLADYRQDNGHLGFTEMTKHAAVQWKDLSDAEKGPYMDASKGAQSEYAEQITVYKESGRPQEWAQICEQLPSKRPSSSFNLYVKDNVRAHMDQGLKVTQAMKLIATQWNDESEDNKQYYQEQSQRLKEQYKETLAQYGL